VHTNGAGDYFDCFPAGVTGDPSSYNLALAKRAAASYAPGVQLVTTACGDSQAVGLGSGPPYATFAYSGSLAGLVEFSDGAPTCPTESSASWT
jgi:hypothetical protein